MNTTPRFGKKRLAQRLYAVDVSEAKSDDGWWKRHKELISLIAGAFIGVSSSYVTSVQQQHLQRQQSNDDQILKTLRQILELNNNSWADFDARLEELVRDAEASEAALSKPRSAEPGKHLAATMASFSTKVDQTYVKLNKDARDYRAKLDTHLTLLSYLTDQPSISIEFDTEMKAMTVDLEAANANLDDAIAKKPVGEEKLKVGVAWLTQLKLALQVQQGRINEERIELNSRLRELATTTLRH